MKNTWKFAVSGILALGLAVGVMPAATDTGGLLGGFGAVVSADGEASQIIETGVLINNEDVSLHFDKINDQGQYIYSGAGWSYNFNERTLELSGFDDSTAVIKTNENIGGLLTIRFAGNSENKVGRIDTKGNGNLRILGNASTLTVSNGILTDELIIDGSGTLNIGSNTNSDHAVYANSVVIKGITVNATAPVEEIGTMKYCGIYTEAGGVEITRGAVVSCTGYRGIYASEGMVSIRNASLRSSGTEYGISAEQIRINDGSTLTAHSFRGLAINCNDVANTIYGVGWLTGGSTETYIDKSNVGRNINSSNFDTVQFDYNSQIVVSTGEVVKAPAANTLWFNGTEQELVTPGTGKYPIPNSEDREAPVFYFVTTDDEYIPAPEEINSTSVPKETQPGTYYVWYKVGTTDSDDDNRIEFLGSTPVPIEVTIGNGAKFEGANISLNGDFGLNYYFTLPASATTENNTTGWKAVVNNGSRKALEWDSQKKMYKVTTDVKVIDSDVSVPVYIVDANNKIVALSDKNSRLERNTAYCSIFRYCQEALAENNEYGLGETAINQIRATYTYAYYAVIWDKGINAVEDVATTDLISIDGVTDLTAYAPVITYDSDNNPEGNVLEITHTSLDIHSKTSFTIMFKCKSSIARGFINGGIFVNNEAYTGKITYRRINGAVYYVVEIPNLGAGDLMTDYTVTFGDYGSVTVSAMSYGNSVLNKAPAEADTDLQDLIKALYVYADTFKTAPNAND